MALGGRIRGKKTSLRLPEEADLARYNDWMADTRVRRLHWVWHEPAMPATWKERLKEIAKDRQEILWSIEADGALVGLAMGSVHHLGAGFSLHHLLIDPDRWRQGYGSDAALALHRYLFDYLDLRRTDIEVQADNLAALRIAERLGYVEYARSHQVFYRDGQYIGQVSLMMDKEIWHQRWSSEREYPPLPADATR